MKVYYFQTIPSTQDLAKEYLHEGNTNAAFVAEMQTHGYGKRQRSFFSPKNTGLYLSCAFPNFSSDTKIGLLTPAIAVEVTEVLQRYFSGVSFKLKWVNDFYVDDSKVGGILTEINSHGLVVGIGINISTQFFPDKLHCKAGFISKKKIDQESLTLDVIKSVQRAVLIYHTGKFLPKYRNFSNVLGRRVVLQLGKKIVSGKAIDVDNEARLVVQTGKKQVRFSTGEIIKLNFLKK